MALKTVREKVKKTVIEFKAAAAVAACSSQKLNIFH
jgi:hypothetical protein